MTLKQIISLFVKTKVIFNASFLLCLCKNGVVSVILCELSLHDVVHLRKPRVLSPLRSLRA